MLSIHNVHKSFGDHNVLNGVSLSVKKGEIFGLLGPNGSGKTTLLNLLMEDLPYESGTIMMLDESDHSNLTIKEKIGMVPDSDERIEDLTGLELLQFIRSVRGLPKQETNRQINEWLKLFDIWEDRHRLLQHYSHGMMKKIQIIAGLLHKPEFLIIDEPTNGLDPDMINMVRHLLKTLQSRGITILLTTHYLHFAETVCDRVCFIRQGEIIQHETKVGDLLKRTHASHLNEAYTVVTDFGEERMKIDAIMEDW
ncbi:ABC transporter ATP-binding protein [Halobacillus litoralis]|uniref:ABC transporter ATP-binding protein n=1 Tax=Halobacillus litoralis TaxID=45668 RepID=UPI001CD514C0|nr:ABC transporter ATP-binding protein [Halobacillus litoralis]MCA0971342.1 ABC transporter ATP-binding protein [Halobacillus litoralis]